MPPTILSGTQMAGTIALISGFGNLGGFLGPYLMGAIEDEHRLGCERALRHRRDRSGGAAVVTGFRWVAVRKQTGEQREESDGDDAHRALR